LRSALTATTCTVLHSEFAHNTAENGAAVMSIETITIDESRFLFNYAHHKGGAIHSGGYVIMTHSVMAHNRAIDGGGIYMEGGAMGLESAGSIIESNTATRGGGIAALNGYFEATDDCTLIRNVAQEGGGFYGSNAMILGLGTGWIFLENSARVGGGMYLRTMSLAELGAINFTNNNAEVAGSAVFAENSTIGITNSVFAGVPTNGGSVVELRNASSNLGEWQDIIFQGPLQYEKQFSCNDCRGLICNAAEGCSDCTGGCLNFTAKGYCTASSPFRGFGCYGSSTCNVVNSKQPLCSCPKDYHGNLCDAQDHHFPTYAIILCVAFGLILMFLSGFYAVAWYKRKSRYQSLDQ